MKKVILGLILCLGSALPVSAFAQDLGTVSVKQECAGFTVTSFEAKSFVLNYNVLILVSSQLVPMQKIANDVDQQKVVDVLKKFDLAEKDGGCIDVSLASLKLTLEIGDKMATIVDAAGASKVYADLLTKMTGSRELALASVKAFQEVAIKMMTLLSAQKAI